jgi:phenylacetate-CoA ligase
LKIWTQVNRKSKFKAWAENIIPIDVTHLSDENIFKLLNNFKSNKRPKAFLGYASSLESICKFIDKENLNIIIPNVNSVIAMSEGLSHLGKKLIHKYFGVHPVSRYSNVENGIIAQQLPNGSNEFIINWASYYVEILAMDSNEKVPLGEVGRIVITDLFNYAMPMIRYDTGDIGVMNWDNNRDKKILTKVEGRKMDLVFDTSGHLVSSFTITNNMWLYPEIKQYQFIQTGKKEYIFKLNLDGVFERENQLVTEFKNYFGTDAIISVEYVDEIPLLNSGKRKKVMNLLN